MDSLVLCQPPFLGMQRQETEPECQNSDPRQCECDRDASPEGCSGISIQLASLTIDTIARDGVQDRKRDIGVWPQPHAEVVHFCTIKRAQ